MTLADLRKSLHERPFVATAPSVLDINEADVRDYCRALASAAGNTPGNFVVGAYGQHPVTGAAVESEVVHVLNGPKAYDELVAAALLMSGTPHLNVYAAWSLMRTDLPSGRKGGLNDVVAVLGLVADFDDADARNYAARLPVPADMIVESSPGRFQAIHILDEPASREDAEPVAQALATFARCDHGTKDVSHVWRVPGLLNWPNKKKADSGRSLVPTLSRIVRTGRQS